MDSTGDRRPIAARGLRPVVAAADWLIRRQASPDGISLAGMAAALGAGLLFAGTGAAPAVAVGATMAATAATRVTIRRPTVPVEPVLIRET